MAPAKSFVAHLYFLALGLLISNGGYCAGEGGGGDMKRNGK